MVDKPKLIKLNDSPSTKGVKKIPLPPLKQNEYDITMTEDFYLRSDIDLEYSPSKNEDHKQNNS